MHLSFGCCRNAKIALIYPETYVFAVNQFLLRWNWKYSDRVNVNAGKKEEGKLNPIYQRKKMFETFLLYVRACVCRPTA